MTFFHHTRFRFEIPLVNPVYGSIRWIRNDF